MEVILEVVGVAILGIIIVAIFRRKIRKIEKRQQEKSDYTRR